jgi:catechol 2,3-dioxygenase-like lactoylglutathione lyase family enzyme
MMREIEGVSHVVIGVADMGRAVESYSRLLDRPAQSFSDGDGRSCAWFDLANISLVLAGAGRKAGSLEALVFRVSDLDRARAGFARCGLAIASPTEASGPSDRRWLEATADPGSTHGVPIRLASRLSHRAQDDGVALDHLVIRTPSPERAIALYGGRLGLDMRLDRANPAWNARLIFFRCGDLVVELAHVLSDGVSDAPDAFGGLSWRVPDIDAAHERLTEAGFTLSPVRAGRRPGSRVCTVRDGGAGVPTILLGVGGAG